MKKKRQFFDECLKSEEQFRKANILRSQVLVDSDLNKRDINKKVEQKYNDIRRFDDCLNGDPALLSRARELREIAKAELWWDKISDEKKEAIRDECVKIEPWIGNEIKIKWFA